MKSRVAALFESMRVLCKHTGGDLCGADIELYQRSKRAGVRETSYKLAMTRLLMLRSVA